MKLFYLFLQGYFKDHLSRFIFSILGITLGIALFTSTQINSDRAERAISDQVLGFQSENLVGVYTANDMVEGSSDQILKDLYFLLPSGMIPVPGFLQQGLWEDSNSSNKNISVIGLDLFANILPTQGEPQNKIPRYLVSPSLYSLWKSKETIKLSVCENQINIKVDEILTIKTAGNFITMDIQDLQNICQRQGYLTHIWLQSQESGNLPSPPTLSTQTEWGFESKETILERSNKSLTSLRINLSIMALVSILISFFMVANTFLGLFLARQKEFGILLSLGNSRLSNVFLFVGQSVILGGLGGIFGISLGYFISNFDFLLPSNTLTNREELLAYADIDWRIIFSGICIALIGSILSSLYAAYRSFLVQPVELVREKDIYQNDKSWSRQKIAIFSFLLILIGLGLGLSPFPKVLLPGLFGVGIIIIAFVFLNYIFIEYFGRFIRKILLSIRFSASKLLALQEVVAEPWKNSLSASTVMLSVSLIFTLTSLTDSYEKSLLNWIQEENHFDFSLIDPKKISNGLPGVPHALLNHFQSDPHWKKAEPFIIKTKFPVNGNFYTLHVLEFPKDWKKDELVVSNNFCYLEKVCKGSELLLPTELSGLLRIRVQNSQDHFFSERGTIMMDYDFYLKHFKKTDINSIRLTRNPSIEATDAFRSLESIAKEYQLQILNQDELKELYIQGMKQVFVILESLKWTALFISILALGTFLLYHLQEKQKMVAGLMAIGMDRLQVFKMLVTQGFFLVGYGSLSGFINSLLLSFIVVHGINKNAFGWNLTFSYPWIFLPIGLLSLPFFALFVAFFPMVAVWKMKLRRELSYE